MSVDPPPAAGSSARQPRFGEDWWRRGVVYQIYPRSFADSDGDGIGDLQGVIDHLDHALRLGVDAIWLSPIYPSPGLDVGYDVSDHAAIDPVFGTEADFDRLVAEAHRRGLRIVLDLVMNHTSDQHPWFEASRTEPDGEHGDWYLWADPAGFDDAGVPQPPNTWVSWFGGQAWTWDNHRGQFYHHTFLREQPELDWRVPAVEDAQLTMVRGWLERGVDGFRLDTFNVFLKDPDLRSNPVLDGTTAWDRQEHRHDIDHPELPDLIERFRDVVDAYPERMSVGELFVGTTEGAAALTRDQHLVFDWELLTRPWSASAFRAAIQRRERAFGLDRWPTVVLSNHDQPRHASRLASSVGAVGADVDAIARAAAVIELTVRGTPFLYYGEEIGMGDVEVPPAESIDTPATRVTPDFVWWDRSACRTPMPWTGAPGGGFTSGTPWLRLGPDIATRNVAAQAADPDSVLACYERVIAARRDLPSLQDGALDLLDLDAADVLAYVRRGTGREAIVVVAFGSGGPVALPPPAAGGRWRAAVGSYRDTPTIAPDGSVILRPYEALVAVAEPHPTVGAPEPDALLR